MANTSLKSVVIGAGIAGLAASIRLRSQGHQVTVLEANAWPGGKLTEFRQDGFRWDAGPSLFTLPELVDELHALAGEDAAEKFSYHRLKNICRYHFPDGTRLDAWSDPVAFAKEVEAVTGEPAERVGQFLKKSEKLWDLTRDLFLYSSIHRIKPYLRKSAWRAFLQLPALGINKTMAQANEKWFDDRRIIQLFNRYATYNGSDPYQAPSTLNIIPHLEHSMGAWFPKGGMHSICDSLVKTAEAMGVEIRYNCRVDRIVYSGKRVTGVHAGGRDWDADFVISNMDMTGTYRKLLPGLKAPERLIKQPKSSSALIFYWGMGARYPDLDLHNIFFSKDYPGEFQSIFKEGKPGGDPTVYVYISSKICPGDAPSGKENWFTMINVPPDQGQDWDRLIPEAREKILDKLERETGWAIRDRIETEKVLDPRGIYQRTSSVQGALYGNSSNSKFAAFLRHANFSSRLKGLYFCGGSVHPGGGIPLCLLSARIVADLIQDKTKASR